MYCRHQKLVLVAEPEAFVSHTLHDVELGWPLALLHLIMTFLLNDTSPKLLNDSQGSFIITVFVSSSQLQQERRKASHMLGMFDFT